MAFGGLFHGQATRTVECYHCLSAISVAARATNLTCPRCYQPIRTDDVVIDEHRVVGQLRTCGVVVVARRSSLRANSVESSAGVEVLGELRANVLTRGPVVIGPKGVFLGDCRAARVVVRPGATILGGRFEVIGQRVRNGAGAEVVQPAARATTATAQFSPRRDAPSLSVATGLGVSPRRGSVA
jgi:cytoskeletal protein CcmA (bactofilin family)